MFGTLGGPELFLIFVVALIVFGPRKLPEIGKSLGKMMAEFRKASNDFRSTIENEVEAEKIREAMRLEPPKYEAARPASPPTEGSSPAPRVEPAVSPDAVSTPYSSLGATAPFDSKAEAVPETVSRQPEPAHERPQSAGPHQGTSTSDPPPKSVEP